MRGEHAGVLVNLLSGGTATFTVNAIIDPAATGTLSNTATVTAPAGFTDPTPGNDSATDTTTLTPQANLSLTKTNGVTSVRSGSQVTYTFTVTNGTATFTSTVTITATRGRQCPRRGVGDHGRHGQLLRRPDHQRPVA